MGIICSFIGHKYEDVGSYSVASGALGTCSITTKECSRCGHKLTKYTAVADLTADAFHKALTTTQPSDTCTHDTTTKESSPLRETGTKRRSCQAKEEAPSEATDTLILEPTIGDKG
jgi:hypothetical protein